MIALCLSLALAQEPVVAEADEAVEAAEQTGPERSSPPAVIPAQWLELDELTRHELGPGQVAWHVRIPGVRKVYVQTTVYGGTHELQGWPTVLASGALRWGGRATTSHDAEELEILQDLNDLSVSTFGSDHIGGGVLVVPKEDLPLGMELLADVLHQPAFPKKEMVQTLRDFRRYYLVQGPRDLGDVASAGLDFGWTPADHEYGARPVLSEMKKAKTSDLLDKQRAWRGLGPATVLVVGDVAWSEVEPLLAPVVEGIGAPGERGAELDCPAPTQTRVVAIDMPGQAQTALRLRYAAPGRLDPDRTVYDPMRWALGGHFLSRLNANLREEKGFTYGTSAWWQTFEKRGQLTIAVDVKAMNTVAAIREIEIELNRLVADGITPAELDMARQDHVSDWNGTRQSGGSAYGFYAGRLRDQESVADAAARQQRIEEVTPEQVAEVAKRWLGDRPHLWVIVGDRASIEPQLSELGWEIEWVSAQDAILGGF